MKTRFTSAYLTSAVLSAFASLTAFAVCETSFVSSSAFAASNLNGDEVVLLSGGLDISSASRFVGTGVFRFVTPQTNLGEKTGHLLRFDLPTSTSSVTFVFYSQENLTQGFNITFLRMPDNTLKVLESANGNSINISSFFKAGRDYPSVKTSENMSVLLKTDTHNDEQPLHNLIWNGAEAAPTEANAFFNSERDGVDVPGNGIGSYRGIFLNNASVTISRLSAPFFQD